MPSKKVFRDESYASPLGGFGEAELRPSGASDAVGLPRKLDGCRPPACTGEMRLNIEQ